MEEDVMIEKIGRAQDLAANGDRDGACTIYADMWAEATHAENLYQECVIAHFMAHAHVVPEAQLAWHLHALHAAHAADAVGDERVRAFYPSLYANLGEVSLRLGNLAQAHEYISRADTFQQILPDDGYGRLIRSLIARIMQAVERDNAQG